MGGKEQPRQRRPKAERIVEIMQAISQEGPLPDKTLAERLQGNISENRVRSIVKAASNRKILEGLTGDGDLPSGLTGGRSGPVQYVQITDEAGCVVGVNIGRTYFAVAVADPNGRLLSTTPLPEKGLPKAAKEAA